MKRIWLNRIALCLLTLSMTACGGDDGANPRPGNNTGESGTGGENGGGNNGGNNGGGNNGGTGSLNPLLGVASNGGSPMANVQIMAVNANRNKGTTAISRADGSFELNVDGFERPIKLFASNKRTPEGFALTSTAFEGQNIANINDATHAVTGVMGNTPTVARQTQLYGLINSALANYTGGTPQNFQSNADYKADFTGSDAVIGQINMAFVGNGILLESRANPARRATIDTTVATPPAVVVPATPATETVDLIELRDLVRGFGSALAVKSPAASKLEPVVHPDFIDPEGDNAATVAQISSEIESIGVERLKILRCFADTTTTRDRCLVRVVLAASTPQELDFGNSAFANTRTTDNYDVIVERRVAPPTISPLKIAGGQFRPFAANTRLERRVASTVLPTGAIGSNSQLATSLVVNVPSGASNQNVTAAVLRRTQNNTSTALLNLLRPGNGQCAGVEILVRNPANSADCTNSLVTNLNNLILDSRNDRLSLGFQQTGSTQLTNFTGLVVQRGVNDSSINVPTLGTASLQALYAYGRSNTPAASLTVALAPVNGFNEVCIAPDTLDSTQAVCVKEARTVSIPNALLPPRLGSYVVFARDKERHMFVRRYNLQ